MLSKSLPSERTKCTLTRHERLLLTSDEWHGPVAGDNPYISADGWKTFKNHLELQFKALDFLRSKSKHNTHMNASLRVDGS
jgi:hypothetical protein